MWSARCPSARSVIVLLLLLLLIESTLRLGGAVLTRLALLGRIAQSNRPRQDVGTLHELNTLLSGLLAAKFDEAEAFRVLGDGVHDDLGVVAARVVLFESGQ